jgi:hypothetical protein
MEVPMRVAVSFDSERGYYTTAPDVPTVTALSLAGVRKRIAAALMPDEVDIKLELDRAARRERDRRRAPPLVSPAATPGRETAIEWFAQQLAGLRSDRRVWCIFDNTAVGGATRNALALQERVGRCRG